MRRKDFAVGTAAVLGSVAMVRRPGSAAQFEFKMASSLAPDHPSSIRLLQMWQAIEKESGGRVHTGFFPAAQLGSDTAMMSQVRIGAIHFGYVAPGVLATISPSAGIAYVGFAFKNVEEGVKVMSGPLGDYVRQEATAKGVHVLKTMWDNGMLQLGSIPHPINTPEDLRDLKIRVSESKIMIDMFKVLGANPVTMNLSEEYTALQTHTIDAEVAPMTVILTSKFYEVNKYLSLLNHTWAGEYIVVNGDTWKSLPPDLQSIIERNNTKYGELEIGDTRRGEASIVAQLKKNGIVVNNVDQAPFRAKLGAFYQAQAVSFGPMAWGLLETGIGHKLA